MNFIKRWLFHAFTLFMFVFTGVWTWGSPFSGISDPMAFFRAQHQDQPKKEAAKALTFTGTVVRDGEQYTLHDPSGVYLLDDSRRARPFDGRPVKVTGHLGDEARIIHVENVELIPA